jgi:hypothetical protein
MIDVSPKTIKIHPSSFLTDKRSPAIVYDTLVSPSLIPSLKEMV